LIGLWISIHSQVYVELDYVPTLGRLLTGGFQQEEKRKQMRA
jgi:hypothetical protein